MNTKITEQTNDALELDQTVAAYLAEHPDFFERHVDLLTELRVPHASGSAVSLIEYQVNTLRKQVRQYRNQLEGLIAVARDNDALNGRLHRLTLALIDAATFDELLNTLQDELHDEFQADAVELRLFSSDDVMRQLESADHMEAEKSALSAFQDFFDKGQPVCGHLQRPQLEYLFGPQAEDTRSAALIPLRAEGVMGMLAIGSRNAERFHPTKGTEFLVRLGEVVSRTLEVVSVPGV
jgi:uncharacterized protein YigA (DUF484 family)